MQIEPWWVGVVWEGGRDSFLVTAINQY